MNETKTPPLPKIEHSPSAVEHIKISRELQRKKDELAKLLKSLVPPSNSIN